MGMKCQLAKGFDFIYRSELDGGLVEHEFDHVLFGRSDVPPVPNPEEVSNYKYVSFTEMRNEMTAHPDDFTTWFRICFERAAEHWGSECCRSHRSRNRRTVHCDSSRGRRPKGDPA